MLKTLRAFCLSAALFSFSANSLTAQVTPATPTIDTTQLQEAKEGDIENIPVVSLDDNDGEDGSAQNITGQLTSGRNAFLDAANFHFSAVRFRIRGYDADMFNTYMNGAPMENLDNGFTPYGLWGGLNDVLRNREAVVGLRNLNYGIGGLGGTNNLDTRAFKQWKQTKVSYSLANRTYRHRVMFTKGTGWTKKGWAFAGSVSRRWADEGFADGTFYDGASFYLGVDKKINDKHILSFVAFATPTEQGRQGSSVREMLDIAGTNFYNPYWGYQNGKKRNSSIARTFQPFGILTHDWKISPKMNLVTAASMTTGHRSLTGLDWYNAPDPRPDYYRYLPSYQLDPAFGEQVRQQLLSDVNLRQINWDRLYETNYSSFATINNVDGIPGNSVSGRRSRYILERRYTATNRYNFNTTLNAALSSRVDLTAGASFDNQKNHYYKRVEDLLGGEFYVDLNQFAERDFPNNTNVNQNDLNHPNRIVREGDKVGYDYNINLTKAGAWAQVNVKFTKLNFFLAGEHSFTQFFRDGHVRNGLNPDNSFGVIQKNNFYNYLFKGGASYRLTTGNYFFVNGGYETRAPFFENAYISPRTRDVLQDDLSNQQILTGEAGYVFNSPVVRARATGYYTTFRKGTDILQAYSDVNRTFVNYAFSNVGKTHRGVEAAVEVRALRGLTLSAAGAYGQFFYDTRQVLVRTADNNSYVPEASDPLVYVKNFNVPTPQQAYNVGFNYRSPKYWFVSAYVNYFRGIWLGFDPIRRTYANLEGIDPTSKLYSDVINQTELKPQFTVDASAGFSWLLNNRFKDLKRRTFLAFNLNVNNALNNTNITSGGFEQLRFDIGSSNVNRFQPRLFYAFGLNYSANISIRF